MPTQVQDAAMVLDALGNPTRRAILTALAAGPRSVGGLASALPVSRPAVSQHLRVLEGASLVVFERDGTRNLYRLEARGFRAAQAWLGGFWTEALSHFAELAESTWEND